MQLSAREQDGSTATIFKEIVQCLQTLILQLGYGMIGHVEHEL